MSPHFVLDHIGNCLDQSHFFTETSMTRLELGEHLDRSRQSVGEYSKLINHCLPITNLEFSFTNERGQLEMTNSLSPYMCWLINRTMILVSLIGTRRVAIQFMQANQDLFSKEKYESELAIVEINAA